MDKTSIRVTLVPGPAADPRVQPAEPPAEEAPARRRRAAALVVALRVFVIAVMAYGIAPSAWRARRDPVELAVAAGPCALLAALFVCVHRAERLTPGSSTPGERRRLHAAVWVLSTLVICLVAYQVSRDLPAAVAIAVWSVVSSIVVASFYMLVLRQDQEHQDLDGVDCQAFNWTKPTTDELV